MTKCNSRLEQFNQTRWFLTGAIEMKRLALLLVCCVWTTSAHAKRPLAYSLEKPGPHQDLKDHGLYQVKVTCSRGAGLSTDSTSLLQTLGDLVIHQNESAIQYLIIGNEGATPDPSDQGKIKLPDKAISIIPVFSIKGSSVVSNFDACQKSIYVQSTQRVYLIPIVAWSKQFTEGAALSGLYETARLISPLWSLFNPASIPATIASKIANAQATEDPIKNILAKLNADQNYGETIRLQTGRYVITTKYSTVTLQVSQIPSIVTAVSDELRQDFRAALDAAPQKIPSTDFEKTCGDIATNLTGAGFSQNEDVPYALTYLARVPLSTKQDIIRCLGKPYAVRAARLGNILWSWIPDEKRVTEDEASIVYPQSLSGPKLQPDFRTIEASLDEFLRGLSRVAKNQNADGTLPPRFVAELKTAMATTVLVNDKTDAAAFDGLPPLDAQKLGEKFVANGYFRFGCYAQITEKFGNNTDGAVAMFLSFHVGKDAPPPAKSDTALGVRALFGKEGLVSQLTVTDKRQAINAALDANSWSCNGFTVQKPS